jgi:hypothetical protein
MSEDEYSAPLQYSIQILLACSCGKSAYPILHRKPPLLKHRSDVMGEFKN